MTFRSCRFVQHESPNLDVTHGSIRRFLSFPVHKFLIKSAISDELFGEFKDLFRQAGIRSVFPLFLFTCGTSG